MLDMLLKSDIVMYYVALFIGFIGIIMMLVFVPFKSVATLMMMLSGLGMVALGLILLISMIMWDLKKRFFDKHHSVVHE